MIPFIKLAGVFQIHGMDTKEIGGENEGVWAVRWSRLFGQLDDGARSSVSAKRSEAKVTLRVMGGQGGQDSLGSLMMEHEAQCQPRGLRPRSR